MGASTNIVLAATGISFGNEWLQTGDINWRIPIAGLVTALVFDGIEMIDIKAARGLAIIMFITVMATPFHGKSPVQTLASLVDRGSKPLVKG